MGEQEFTYTPYIANFDTGERGYQPLLKVTVAPCEGFLPFKTEALVDSGAEDTLFNAIIGEAIGIQVAAGKPRKIGGVIGKGEGYEHIVHFVLPELKAEFNIPVIFVPQMGFSVILGQNDFFNKYHVRFERDKLHFYTTKVPKIKFTK